MFPPRTQGTLQNMLRWFAQGKFEKLLWENLFVVLVLGSVISSRGCVVITGYRGYSSGLKQSGSRQHRPTICPYRDNQQSTSQTLEFSNCGIDVHRLTQCYCYVKTYYIMVLLSAKNHIDRLFQRSLFINFTDYCVCCVSMSNVDNFTSQTIILGRDNRYLGRWIDGYLHQISSRVPEPEAGQDLVWGIRDTSSYIQMGK